MSKSIPFFHQYDQMDCGATCLAMVAKHYGKTYTIQKLRDMCSAFRAGVSMLGISDAAEKTSKRVNKWTSEQVDKTRPLVHLSTCPLKNTSHFFQLLQNFSIFAAILHLFFLSKSS